jgi:hypothetical protein
LVLGLFNLVGQMAAAAPLATEQPCRLAYGSSPFASLTFQYEVVGRAPAGWAVVDVSVAYTRTSLEQGIEYLPIEANGVHAADVTNGDLSFSVESTIDYAGGTITFDRDDSVRGELAILNYTSDGMDGFAVYECAPFPSL